VLDIAGRGALATTAHIGRPRVRVASVAYDTVYPGTIPVFARLDRADLIAVVELVEAGKLTVRVAATYPLERAAEAQAVLAEGRSRGKIVLEISSHSAAPIPASSGLTDRHRLNRDVHR
jgi:NADPH:quinone reductase-like Zn-dependent oxidoreductase